MRKASVLRVPDYLLHILEAIRRINVYTEDMIELDFLKNLLVQDGVIRNIEIIGEAARNIEWNHPEFLELYPDVPLMIAYEMRNALAHGYYKVDLEIVWKTIENDLPVLQQQIQNIYQEFQSK